MKRWSILYRGSLSSCNYACDYCPFAKTSNTRSELAKDREELERFVTWVEARPDQEIGVFFTPWGEALIRKYYRDAIVRLSHLPNVWKVAIQTNFSTSTSWVKDANLEKVGFWMTWHPTQTSMERFVEKCFELDAIGASYSVGVVGFKEELENIQKLRARLRPNRYLWINAFKRDPKYYQPEDIRAFEEIDPYFRLNTVYHLSRGGACQAGETSFSVDGNGDARRCHFIREPIGNIYDPSFASCLRPRPCTNKTCGCFIGYVHMDRLGLYEEFGDGILERIPRTFLPEHSKARKMTRTSSIGAK